MEVDNSMDLRGFSRFVNRMQVSLEHLSFQERCSWSSSLLNVKYHDRNEQFRARVNISVWIIEPTTYELMTPLVSPHYNIACSVNHGFAAIIPETYAQYANISNWDYHHHQGWKRTSEDRVVTPQIKRQARGHSLEMKSVSYIHSEPTGWFFCEVSQFLCTGS